VVGLRCWAGLGAEGWAGRNAGGCVLGWEPGAGAAFVAVRLSGGRRLV
jgi:hypothetical protein